MDYTLTPIDADTDDDGDADDYVVWRWRHVRDDIVTATYVNARGESIEWGVDGPHVLERLDGVSGLNALATTSRAPGQDGETWMSSRMPMRTITLTGAVMGAGDELGTRRSWLMRVTNPRLGPGMLTVTAHRRTRRIAAYVDGAPMMDETMGLPWQRYTMSLACPMPYWEDDQDSVLYMRRQVGGLRFPLSLPTYFARVNVTQQYLARNLGDVDCPLVMEFAGGAINPSLTNLTTGEAIIINTTIPADHRLIVSTGYGDKRAVLHNDLTGEETNAMMHLDLSSVFFALRVGDNYLTYSADVGAAEADVSARWRMRYAGI